jgi:hypothetical protein
MASQNVVEFPVHSLEFKDDCVLGSVLFSDPVKYPPMPLVSIDALVRVIRDSCDAWSSVDVRSLLRNIGDDEKVPSALKWVFTLHPRVLNGQRINEPTTIFITNVNINKATFQAMYPRDYRCHLIPLDLLTYLPDILQRKWYFPSGCIPIEHMSHESLETNAFSKVVAAAHQVVGQRPIHIFRSALSLSMVECKNVPISRPSSGEPGMCHFFR